MLIINLYYFSVNRKRGGKYTKIFFRPLDKINKGNITICIICVCFSKSHRSPFQGGGINTQNKNAPQKEAFK